MNIALCTDNNYAFPCGVCITSILENNKGIKCNIYILTEGLDDKTYCQFKQLAIKYQQNIIIKVIDSTIFNNLKTAGRFNKSIYFRFIIPQLLDVDKILYLDCDIITTDSLKVLWNTDIEGVACACIEDQRSDDIRLQNNLKLYKPYFNSGVLLMNLDYWRKHNIAEKLVTYIYENPNKCIFPDQDALNNILVDKVKFIDFTYNYQDAFFDEKENIFLHFSKLEKLKCNAENPPVIIHYTNPLKPWHSNCNHPLKDFFLHYKDLGPWKNVKIKHYYPLSKRIFNIIRKCYNNIFKR